MRELTPTPRVLCVDDDASVLSGLERVLHGAFDVVTANNPMVALDRLGSDPGFHVVLCDMKMPGLDGVTFLTRAKQILPSASRVMLTGAPNLECAIAAINQGSIFRFLTKPCPPQLLLETLYAAAQQRGALAERCEASPSGSAVLTPWPGASEAVHGYGFRSAASLARAGAARPFCPDLYTTGPEPSHGAELYLHDATVRSGCLLAALAADAEDALASGRGSEAERMLTPPLQSLLKNAQSGKPTDADDVEMAAVFAARLAGATCKGTWIDYIFRLFGALRRLLSNPAIDEVHAALCHARADVGPLQLYISILEFHGKNYGPAERCLLRRIQRCRALIAMRSAEPL